MEDVLAELRERNLDVASPLELPTEDQLIIVEEEILMPLPADYKGFLLLVSDVICGSIEPATVADPNAHSYLSELTANAWEQGLSREYIPICEYKGGYFYITQTSEIGFWPSDNDDENSWESIWHWARDIWLNS